MWGQEVAFQELEDLRRTATGMHGTELDSCIIAGNENDNPFRALTHSRLSKYRLPPLHLDLQLMRVAGLVEGLFVACTLTDRRHVPSSVAL